MRITGNILINFEQFCVVNFLCNTKNIFKKYKILFLASRYEVKRNPITIKYEGIEPTPSIQKNKHTNLHTHAYRFLN